MYCLFRSREENVLQSEKTESRFLDHSLSYLPVHADGKANASPAELRTKCLSGSNVLSVSFQFEF